MADVELIIRIDEEMYKWVNDANKFFGDYGIGDFIDLVKSGTLLPKGNERLKDAVRRQDVLDLIADYDLSMGQVVRGIHALPPIIPQQNIGYWIFDDECKEHGHCSHCGYGSVDLVDGTPHNYCSNCGIKIEVK